VTLRVRQVEGRRGLKAFIDVTWRVLDPASHPSWVPPLRLMVKDLLDTRADPFYRSAERALFIAERDGRPVGRIAAIENRRHNEHFGDRVGFFGFFECVNEAVVAEELFAVAEEWLAGRGLTVARGPVSPSMNHECGLLVDGFDARHVLLTPWNPRYYEQLIGCAGYEKARDLLAYDLPLDRDYSLPGTLERLSDRVRRSSGLVFRSVDLRKLEEEIRHIWLVYSDAWSDNWGFVPPNWEEFRYLAMSMKPIVRPDFSFIAEADGEPVGFMLIVADINRLMPSDSQGRLTPWLLGKLLFRTRKLVSGRLILLGVNRGRRGRSIFPLMLQEALRRGRAIGGETVEGSWILEDNEALRAPIERLGLHPYRRWRIYDKELA
jgi:hypothetical protein